MSKEKFNEQLTRAMRVLGRNITTSCTSYSSYGEIRLTPQDGSENIIVEYELGQARDKGEIRFLGSSFRLDSRTGQYRIERAVGLLLAEEGKILQERKKRKEQEQINREWRKRYDWARGINENLNEQGKVDININVDVPYEKTCKQYDITINTEDRAMVMAIVDYLRDGGFVETKKIETEICEKCGGYKKKNQPGGCTCA